jgi:hypothetical protein
MTGGRHYDERIAMRPVEPAAGRLPLKNPPVKA